MSNVKGIFGSSGRRVSPLLSQVSQTDHVALQFAAVHHPRFRLDFAQQLLLRHADDGPPEEKCIKLSIRMA